MDSVLHFSSLVEAVAYWAEQTPDKVCLIEAETDRKLTYGEFWRRIRIFARRLSEYGLCKGDRVVVRVGPLLETFVAQFGIYLAGGVYCPVEKHMKELKMLEMLDYYDSTLLISSERVEFAGQYIEIGSVLDDGEPLENYTFPNPEDMCAIVFTTGTTGKAKGVMIPFKNPAIYGDVQSKLFSTHKNDSWLWSSSLDRAGGIRAFSMSIESGGCSIHLSDIVFIGKLFASIEKP